MRKLLLVAALATAGITSFGCEADSSDSNSFSDRQNKALADPMHYKPPTHYGVSDNKGLKDDWHSFTNP